MLICHKCLRGIVYVASASLRLYTRIITPFYASTPRRSDAAGRSDLWAQAVRRKPNFVEASLSLSSRPKGMTTLAQ